MPSQSRITLRVRYAETDQMGVVYHANYFVWFEMGRVELLRELGFSYAEMEREDCHLPVVEATCRYRVPAHYDETLMLETHVSLMRGSIIKFAYRLSRMAAESPLNEPPSGNAATIDHLADAETTHIVVDRRMKRRALPEKYAEALRAALAGQL
jgi:acyl-CoA thioester hydrolase